MPNSVCPDCGSDLERDLLESTGRAECPFCGADVSKELPPTSAESGDETAVTLPPLPEKSLIEVIESTPQRRVFYISGGRSRSIGCFALMWNLITGGVSGGFLVSMLGDDKFPGGWIGLLGLLAFFSLFWAVGIGLIFWWIKAKFERLFLLLDRDRFIIQRILFGRKRIEETTLENSSRAELVESYSENDRPVYHIEIAGVEGSAKFGTALSLEEKDWLVDRINEFLHPTQEKSAKQPPPKYCFNCGAQLSTAAGAKETVCPACGQEIPGDSPGDDTENFPPDETDVPQPSEVTMESQTGDRLRFHLPGCSNPIVRWVFGIFAIGFGASFVSFPLFGLFAFGNQKIFEILFAIPFILGGLSPIAVGLFLLRGRITCDLSPERLRVRYHVGPLGYYKTANTEAISQVYAGRSEKANPRIHDQSRPNSSLNMEVCFVQARRKRILLSVMNERGTARFVAQLVRGQLGAMGHELPKAS